MSDVLLRRLGLQETYSLTAYQVSVAGAGAGRGWHWDNEYLGDVICTLTLQGDGQIGLEVPEVAGARVYQEARPFDYYAIYGECLRPQRHSVAAGREGRISVTFRYNRV